jgi:hypothetical protein
MHLDVRLGVLFDERADPARLRSRQKLTHHSPTFAGRAEQPLRSPPPLLCEKTRAAGDPVTSVVPRAASFAHSRKEIGGTARALSAVEHSVTSHLGGFGHACHDSHSRPVNAVSAAGGS